MKYLSRLPTLHIKEARRSRFDKKQLRLPPPQKSVSRIIYVITNPSTSNNSNKYRISGKDEFFVEKSWHGTNRMLCMPPVDLRRHGHFYIFFDVNSYQTAWQSSSV